MSLVDVELLEYSFGESFDELLYVGGAYVEEVVVVSEPYDGFVGFVLGFDVAHDVFAYHAADVAGKHAIVQLVEVVLLLDVVVSFVGCVCAGEHVGDALTAWKEVGWEGVGFDWDEMWFEFHFDEVFIVEYESEIFLGVVVELSGGGVTMMRNSRKKTPCICCPFLEKNLKRSNIFYFSLDLTMRAGWDRQYRYRR